MEIIHRIGFSNKDELEEVLREMGVKYKKAPLPGQGNFFGFFDIKESDPLWPEIAKLVEENRLADVPHTTFDVREVRRAEWVRLLPDFHFGYPQPEDGWKDLTYEEGCATCGVGFRQNASFRIAREPRLGRRDFGSLFWTCTLFATSAVFDAFRSAQFRGYEHRPALIHRTGQPASTIGQVFVLGETAPGLLNTKNLRQEVCPDCGRTRFDPVSRGMIEYEREAIPANIDIVRSSEWFGSGHFAYQEMLVSRRVVDLILDRGWRGAALEPLGLE